jgi:hypothetical protein
LAGLGASVQLWKQRIARAAPSIEAGVGILVEEKNNINVTKMIIYESDQLKQLFTHL